MKLPDQQRLDDAHWQLDHATQQVVPLLATLQARQEPDDPALREAYEQDQLLLRTLRYYFTANAANLDLMRQTVEEMNKEMHEANGRYRNMKLERDFYLHEAQAANDRYYHENDALDTLTARLSAANRV